MSNIKTTSVKEKEQETKDEVVPIRKNKRFLAIILRDNKSTIWKWVSYRVARFQEGDNTYFKEPSGVYLSSNKVLCSVYIEGVSLPINHSILERGFKDVEIVNPASGELETVKIPYVSNLKFDSKIADMLLNRNLADEFTKAHIDKLGFIMILLLIINLVIGIGAIASNFI